MKNLENLGKIYNLLVSVHPHFRKQGFEDLKGCFMNIGEEEYKKVAYSLFYYYWYSDGYEN